MAFAGELLSLVVSLAQEIGIVAGVGALTITLVGHLLSLHTHVSETVYGYVRAARHIRAIALMAIIISGGAAVLIHFQTGTPGILLQPAFLFKWLVIALLTAFYFVELKVTGVKRDAVEGFEGANWYALFIVHTVAPALEWTTLLFIYASWLATFAIIWASFVWIMRRQSMVVQKAAAPIPASVPAPVPPKPAPVLVQQAPVLATKKSIEVHPNHSMLPMIAELDLPAPKPSVPPAPVAPAPNPVPPRAPMPPKPSAVEVVQEPPKPAVSMPNLDEGGLPALHVMPKRPEDIDSSKRGPVIKMTGDE